jgi:hypothetical protein
MAAAPKTVRKILLISTVRRAQSSKSPMPRSRAQAIWYSREGKVPFQIALPSST